jgi:hypothetical protein
MTKLWRTPKNWKAGEALTPLKLNTYVSSQFDYLRYRNPVACEDSTGIVLSSTTLIELSYATLKLITEVQDNEDLLIETRMWYRADSFGSSRILFFDFFVDDTYYLSSGTPTAKTRGVMESQPNETNQLQVLTYRTIVQGLTQGEHTFSLYAGNVAGTITFGRINLYARGY